MGTLQAAVVSVASAVVLAAALTLLAAAAFVKFRLSRRRLRPELTVAFFHPYCNAGTGTNSYL